MFGFFRRKEDNPTSAFDVALKRLLLFRELVFHEACLTGYTHDGDWNFNKPAYSHDRDWNFSDKEKADLVTNLYFLGAVDCASQRHSLSDQQFGQLIMAFFKAIGTHENYASFMVMCFLKKNIVPLVEKCITEGGQYCNTFLNGKRPNDTPLSTKSILSFYNNPNFPKTAGQIYVTIEKK